jgi:hypothetical protein
MSAAFKPPRDRELDLATFITVFLDEIKQRTLIALFRGVLVGHSFQL